MKLRRLLPGSLTPHGGVVDHEGHYWFIGPCFVPEAALFLKRKAALGAAGWCVCPARDWPSMLPAAGLVCLVNRDRYK